MLKLDDRLDKAPAIISAAFGRLCVETLVTKRIWLKKPDQPPSGGCVLKPRYFYHDWLTESQPPSGGCVLKQLEHHELTDFQISAAFGRLCVETALIMKGAGDSRLSRLRAAVC